MVHSYGIKGEQFIQNHASVMDGEEDTTRSRSFMFFAHAIAYASAMNKSIELIIPENGLISLNIPLAHTRLGHLPMIFDAKWQNFCVRKIPMPMPVQAQGS